MQRKGKRSCQHRMRFLTVDMRPTALRQSVCGIRITAGNTHTVVRRTLNFEKVN